MVNQYGQSEIDPALIQALTERRQQNQQRQQMPSIPNLQGLMGGETAAPSGASPAASPAASGPSGMSNLAGSATPLLYAYLIGQGKMIEGNNPDSALGKGLLGGLGPSFNQLKEDPVGMGLPSLLGVPFLAPFFASDDARKAKPEFAGIWESLGLPG